MKKMAFYSAMTNQNYVVWKEVHGNWDHDWNKPDLWRQVSYLLLYEEFDLNMNRKMCMYAHTVYVYIFIYNENRKDTMREG